MQNIEFYGDWAHNMALSIRAHSSLPIQVITDGYRDWETIIDSVDYLLNVMDFNVSENNDDFWRLARWGLSFT